MWFSEQIYELIKDEVKLRAANNYGDWQSVDGLTANVRTAIAEVLEEVVVTLRTHHGYELAQSIIQGESPR